MLHKFTKFSAAAILAAAGALAIADPFTPRGPAGAGGPGGAESDAPHMFGEGPHGPKHARGFGHGRMMHRMHEKALERFDANADGALDETERATARATFEAEHPEAAARMRDHHQRILERFDADRNGSLDESERAAAHEAGREHMRHRMHERRAGMIERFDTDKDGALSEAERAAAHELGRERMRARHELALQKFDADADGSLNQAERQAAREFHRDRMREHHEAILAEFDADKDGRLSREEREAAHPTLHRRHIAMGNFFGIDANHDRAIDAAELARGMELIRDANIRADFNGDGAINEADAAALLQRASEKKPGADL